MCHRTQVVYAQEVITISMFHHIVDLETTRENSRREQSFSRL